MKSCSKCKEQRPLDRFAINDYGRPISWCKECMSQRASERYREKIEASNVLKMSQTETSFPSENQERKCKDFFFYA